MVHFEKYKLANGLTVILHEDKTSPLVAINTLYKVGARNENPHKTGFAHLFEHLMFGGSKHIANFDTPLQECGGENNAFTNNDITNYYITLPAENIEIGFWLESDRMLQLDFSQKILDVQKNVVQEEFKQRYLNQPYGDLWLKLRPLAYKVHPYRWATIGKDLSHIEQANLEDVKSFFYKYYRPNNAILVVSGNFDHAKVKDLIEKWYGDIPRGEDLLNGIEPEPKQNSKRVLETRNNVPIKMLTKVYHMVDRKHPQYKTTDLISDILANGQSSRFFQNIVKAEKGFISADAYISGSYDNGLFVISSKLKDELSFDEAEKIIDEEISTLCEKGVQEEELARVKNKFKTTALFNQTNILNKAMDLAYYEFLDHLNWVNEELDAYMMVDKTDIMQVVGSIFNEQNACVLKYDKL